VMHCVPTHRYSWEEKMISSFSFDPLADNYDATRGYPPGVAQQIAHDLAQAINARPGTRFLEVGVGTGRIALPLASLGFDYSGADISRKMVALCMDKLRDQGWQEESRHWGSLPDEKSTLAPDVWRFRQAHPPASMRLALADMTALPFADASFDVSLGVHVFHLVSDWRQAVQEAMRVVRAGGLFMQCWDENVSAEKWPINKRWEEIIIELGGEVRRSRAFYEGVIESWLRENGFQPQVVRLTRWEEESTPREGVEHLMKRLSSGTRRAPDKLFNASIEPLERWAKDYFGDRMDVPQMRAHQFVLCKTEVMARA
jgi:ubiquinone/menaquinone biosynthesis C-methylase UbiE